ncbi:hypothetical protein CANINC_004581 [Pichia inconspicua]|uniref:DNA polymerase eta n=1 Tax=Pichia inconspicua TaxID=52247 RepID=A0A4T0WX73_9ASCO|nr:hypothetical protein CANINC_004581 [[Candida] inconspicua]
MVVFRPKGESRYTFKNLLDLNDSQKAFNSPLAVICHIDMNAFFAQCEQYRLGLSDADPVVCVQWSSIIAVSYAAREYGITRMDKLEQAKLKCPHLIAAHTAVFKKGDPVWKYVDYIPSPVDHKVSLDPYRREGRKILNMFRSECDLVEKASVDESFMDLGRLIFKRVLEIYPNVLDSMKSKDDLLPQLSYIPDDLEFCGFVIAKSNEEGHGSGIAEANSDYCIEDWDDLLMLIGSQICYDMRKKVEKELGYKTSGGVGRVKTIAKLASGFKKPDQQTIVRNDAIPSFLKYFKVTDFWSLGGKIGEYIKERLEDDKIATIRETYDSPEKLIKLLGNDADLGNRLFKIVRGELHAKVESKENIKSMMSNKNFRGKSVKNVGELMPWLDVFIGELILRNQELDEENQALLRPTKITLSASGSTYVRHSKQCTISQPPKDYEKLKQLYKNLVESLVKQLQDMWVIQNPNQPLYPIVNACLAISSFIDISNTNTLDDLMSTVKKRKISILDEGECCEDTINSDVGKKKNRDIMELFRRDMKAKPISANDDNVQICEKCGSEVIIDDWETHKDFHVAVDLDNKLNQDFTRQSASNFNRTRKIDKQMKLPFN